MQTRLLTDLPSRKSETEQNTILKLLGKKEKPSLSYLYKLQNNHDNKIITSNTLISILTY